MTDPITVIGGDVASKRWIAVVLRDGAFQDAVLIDHLTELIPRVGQAATIALDIPIGRPVGGEDWPREADLEARKWIGPRRSSVFPSPPRPVLECTTYAEANALHRGITKGGKGLSRQSWALRERILEAEAFALQHSHVVEVHPEVSFRALNGEPLAHRKKSWNGQHARRELLAGASIHIPDDLDAGDVPADDLLDAAVAAWSAYRFAVGTASRLGRPTPDGQPNPHAGRIWY